MNLMADLCPKDELFFAAFLLFASLNLSEDKTKPNLRVLILISL